MSSGQGVLVDIENEIERALSQEADRARVRPEMIEGVLRRSRIRRVLNLGAATFALAAVAVGVNVGARSLMLSHQTAPASRTRGVVPWVDRPAPRSTPSSSPSPVSPTARSCHAAD